MTYLPRTCVSVGLVLGLLLLVPAMPTNAATKQCGSAVLTGCTIDGDGMNFSAEALTRLVSGKDPQTGEPEKRFFGYTSATDCAQSVPGGPNADIPCGAAVAACEGNTPEQGLGPQVRIYRRELGPNGTPITGEWQQVGTTCLPQLVPGRPVLGMAQILAAFHNTPWAKPAVHTQPEGNTTLVTLATYFEVTWPAAGYQPEEIDTTTLLGRQLRIRPTAISYTYHFGDGTTLGPTPSPGGTYPEGDITHAYPKAGTYNSTITITYGGQFSVNNGPWIPIPDTAAITGSTQPITVKTAHPRLVIE